MNFSIGVIGLKIANYINHDFQERRKVFHRKEANEAYRKNASYTQASKMPMLKILESLLSGETEKALFEKDTHASPISEISQTAAQVSSGNQEESDRLALNNLEYTGSNELLQNLHHRIDYHSDQASIEKTFNKAIASYKLQMQLAQIGLRNESSFSQTA